MEVQTSNKNYIFDSSDYFGSGVILSNNCDHSYKKVNNILIPCFDDYFELLTYSKRGIFQLDIHSCINGESAITMANMRNNFYATIMGKQSNKYGYITAFTYLDFDDDSWHPNTDQIFEVNAVEYIDEVTVVSIVNNNKADTVCIDSVMINDESALYLSENWIGGSSTASIMNAIFKYPVCKTEVVGLRIDYDNSRAHLLKEDTTISGLECINNNRLISTTCSISQSYDLSKTTTFSISNEDLSTSEYSWGKSSSVTLGTTTSESNTESDTSAHTRSTATSDEFSFGFNQQLTVGMSVETEAGAVFAKATTTLSAELSVGANQQWTSTTEEGTEHSTEQTQETSTGTEETEENTEESSEQQLESQSSSSGYESSYETSTTATIECSGEVEVPPSNSISYSLIFNAFNTTINTYTDLKLTLCSAFFDPINPDDDSHYVYIDNIPGIIEHKEITACNVEFEPVTYIRNDIQCKEEQKLSISEGSDYFPRCREDGSYDGCQCDKDKTVCWCVDENGNKLDDYDTGIEIEERMLWQEICLNKLQCDNSDISYSNLLRPLEHGMDCATLQKLAIYNGDSYLPRCSTTDNTKYDGCQCDLGIKTTLSTCWCSTADGSAINGKAMQIKDGMSEEQVCAQILQCENTEITYNSSILTSLFDWIENRFKVLYILLLSVIGVFIVFICLRYFKLCCNNNVNNYMEYKYSKLNQYDIEANTELDEDIPLK